MEKVNTSMILYCLYHFREKKKVTASKVTGLKGFLPWSGLSVACLFMRLTTFYYFFNAVQICNN